MKFNWFNNGGDHDDRNAKYLKKKPYFPPKTFQAIRFSRVRQESALNRLKTLLFWVIKTKGKFTLKK